MQIFLLTLQKFLLTVEIFLLTCSKNKKVKFLEKFVLPLSKLYVL